MLHLSLPQINNEQFHFGCEERKGWKNTLHVRGKKKEMGGER